MRNFVQTDRQKIISFNQKTFISLEYSFLPNLFLDLLPNNSSTQTNEIGLNFKKVQKEVFTTFQDVKVALKNVYSVIWNLFMALLKLVFSCLQGACAVFVTDIFQTTFVSLFGSFFLGTTNWEQERIFIHFMWQDCENRLNIISDSFSALYWKCGQI